tara:strand:- start:1863 stop:2066 length:204 start_codon:yes stop_codon:yes gene_type:complete
MKATVAPGTPHDGSGECPRAASSAAAITTQKIDPMMGAMIILALGAWSAAERFTVKSPPNPMPAATA